MESHLFRLPLITQYAFALATRECGRERRPSNEDVCRHIHTLLATWRTDVPSHCRTLVEFFADGCDRSVQAARDGAARAAHTIAGSSSFLGLADVQREFLAIERLIKFGDDGGAYSQFHDRMALIVEAVQEADRLLALLSHDGDDDGAGDADVDEHHTGNVPAPAPAAGADAASSRSPPDDGACALRPPASFGDASDA